LKEPIPNKLIEKFWLVSADMGYGHQRAIFPLRDLAYKGMVLNANHLPDSSDEEKNIWRKLRRTYEFISRAVEMPLLGYLFSKILDLLLYIPAYQPVKSLKRPTIQVKYLRKYIAGGLCNSLVELIARPAYPIVTSFYATAIAAEARSLNMVYCIICDTDLNRAWVSENPSSTRIIYFVPGTIAARRLISYGVSECNIVLTGFPLPAELLGGRNLNILLRNLSERLLILDPNGRFHCFYYHKLNEYLKAERQNGGQRPGRDRRLTLTYVVGGAGAQKKTAAIIIRSFSEKILKGEICINLVAGTRADTRDYFVMIRKRYVPGAENVRVIWAENNENYFTRFNDILHTTDILWTKPSELSFYSALGLPVIISRPIGPQEKCNRKWLLENGAGIDYKNERDVNQWISGLLSSGKLAEASFNGFLKGRKFGTFNIIDYLEKGSFINSTDPLKR
jgi:hypothetical protein